MLPPALHCTALHVTPMMDVFRIPTSIPACSALTDKPTSIVIILLSRSPDDMFVFLLLCPWPAHPSGISFQCALYTTCSTVRHCLLGISTKLVVTYDHLRFRPAREVAQHRCMHKTRRSLNISKGFAGRRCAIQFVYLHQVLSLSIPPHVHTT